MKKLLSILILLSISSSSFAWVDYGCMMKCNGSENDGYCNEMCSGPGN